MAAETVGRIVWETWDGKYGVDIEHHHVEHLVLTSSGLRLIHPVRQETAAREPRANDEAAVHAK
ncbi:hypothetical protein ACFY84_29495 [Streptomyces sp. NPDC012438]|uniref:hypothetical protein n=1 Tax=Streptomyces sp. NPDC012438 TaxID=3364833 RepID=UPI0036E9370C